MQATEEELAALNERRKKEKELILARDQDAPSDSPQWFMISSDWLYQWKCFISNKVS